MDDVVGCDCWRLLRELEDEELPDHIHWEIAAQNVGAWTIQRLAGREADHADALYDPLTTFESEVSSDVLDEARWVEFQPFWPQRTDGRSLILVLRQWVQEAGNKTLAKQLSQLPEWQQEVARYRSAYERWRSHPEWRGSVSDEMWISDPDRV